MTQTIDSIFGIYYIGHRQHGGLIDLRLYYVQISEVEDFTNLFYFAVFGSEKLEGEITETEKT